MTTYKVTNNTKTLKDRNNQIVNKNFDTRIF